MGHPARVSMVTATESLCTPAGLTESQYAYRYGYGFQEYIVIGGCLSSFATGEATFEGVVFTGHSPWSMGRICAYGWFFSGRF